MAGKTGESSLNLKNLKLDLLKKGHEFSFFQVMRLLRLLGAGQKASSDSYDHETGNIRMRPELSLAFPASDISKIEEIEGEEASFLITATFLGLYGPSSPLPTFYTEDLLDEASRDSSVARDFLDIFNHRIFSLLFHCWTKYRQFYKVIEEKNEKDMERLFCLMGLGEEKLRKDMEAYSLIRYAGLFTQFPRSTVGLETLLSDAFRGIPVAIIPCLERKVAIPEDQRLYLGISGNYIGEDCVLGEEITDRMGKFRIKLGPVEGKQFNSLLRGSPDHKRLAFLTKFYLADQLEFDIELILAEKEVETACLGAARWSRLGLDTWTFTGDFQGDIRTVVPPQYN